MGGVVSAGIDNDDLVDKLKAAVYIKSKDVEKVFRLVDRGFYLTKDSQNLAYRDNAWRSGNLHMSAPCIYAQVMEGLQIGPSMSFLNIGSGTGYLSTMAGLLIGPNGINHGIELHSDVVEYATERLNWFLANSGSIDVSFFCEPQFSQGNALSLKENKLLYDRVYCGASCPTSHEDYMKNLIKINGILVMPRNDQLLKIVRTDTNSWTTESLLPVSFSSLIMPDPTLIPEPVDLPPINIYSLQELSREAVRAHFRSCIESENHELKDAFVFTVPPYDSSKDRKPVCRIGRAFPDEAASSLGPDLDSDGSEEQDADWVAFHQSQELQVSMHTAFIELARSFITRTSANTDRGTGESEREIREEEEEEEEEGEELNDGTEEEEERRERGTKDESRSNETGESDRMVVESDDNNERDDDEDDLFELLERIANRDRTIRVVATRGFGSDRFRRENTRDTEEGLNKSGLPGGATDGNESEPDDVAGRSSSNIQTDDDDEMAVLEEVKHKHSRDNGNRLESKIEEPLKSPTEAAVNKRNETSETNVDMSDQETVEGTSGKMSESGTIEEDSEENLQGETSSPKKDNKKKREKFDSGIVEDMDHTMSIDSSSSCSFKSRSNSLESSLSEGEGLDKFRSSNSPTFSSGSKNSNNGRSWRSKAEMSRRRKRKTMRYPKDSKTDSGVPIQKYSRLMKEKINELPLPFPLKVYINYNRPL